jgi:hypothetical protein
MNLKGRDKVERISTNIKVYDLEESLVASGYAMLTDYNEEEIKKEIELLKENVSTDSKHYKRAERLLRAALDSGHPNFLTGVRVSMDVTFTNKVWVEWQRYNFQDIVTSFSTMHRISKFDLDEAFIKYTDKEIIERLKVLQKEYLDDPTPENYLKLLYSTPSGLKLTARVSTNYMQLAHMYKQRRNHRLPEWNKFTQELLELPLFYEFLKMNNSLDNKDLRVE